jgi:FG-GAP-like repeat
MVHLRVAIPAVGAVAMLLSSAAFQAQTFTWGPVHSVNLPARAVFENLSPMDMNGDGNTDICLSMWNVDSTGSILEQFKYIFVGDGAGNFAATAITAHESQGSYAYGTVQFFDVNGDGFADEVYSYGGFTSCCIPPDEHPGVFAVLLGDGKGNFTQTTSIPLGLNWGNGNSILAAGSFRNNGKVDFATVFGDPANPGHGVLTVYLNDGGGMFHVGWTTNVTGGSTLSPVAGDFNGDGRLDIAWLDASAEPGTNNRFAVHCLSGNGDGTFGADKICYTLDGHPDGMASANLNGDHKADLVVITGPKVGASGARARVATLLAKQTGGFYWSSAASVPPGIEGATSVYGMPPLSLSDLNGDGYPDVILSGRALIAGGANGIFGKLEVIGFQGNFNPAYFAPLKKGGLPALFYSANDDGDFSTKFSWQLNTSPK